MSLTRILFSESDITAIVQACCCLPDDPNLHLNNPVIYLTQQLRILRRVRFEAPQNNRLRVLLAGLESQVCEALAFELIDSGALTEQGLNVDVIAQNFLFYLQGKI